jgi:molybdopterin-synthase adenylyltransferase
MTMLEPQELQRYARHIMLSEVGGAGQQKLKAARVLLIGAGGIGAPAALYLAAAGVGTLGLADDDVVSLSNLQRQVLYGTADIGAAKVDRAAERLTALNPHVAIERHPVRLTMDNGPDIVRAYDLVIDGSDNFATRYTAAALCEAAERPLVQATVQRFSGALTLLAPFTTLPDASPAPRLTDLFPEAPPEGSVPTCAEAGILGVVTGILGTMAAAEAVKHICGIGDPLIGRLLMVDVLSMRFSEIRYRR